MNQNIYAKNTSFLLIIFLFRKDTKNGQDKIGKSQQTYGKSYENREIAL